LDKIKQFKQEVSQRIKENSVDDDFQKQSADWRLKAMENKYVYNFEWMGRPIIQFPQDILAMQQIIWQVKPDLIIETGIAHGGSIVFSASMLELLGGDGEVLGIDIDIREHNRAEIEKHPMYKRISLIEGSAIDDEVVKKVLEKSKGKQKIMVILDSNHTHEHVLKELELYSPLVSKESYLLVFDTLIEEMPQGFFDDRPWDVGDNPKTAVHEFLKTNRDFEIDHSMEARLMVTVAPDGFLKRVN